ncbi:unnamed protein product, partial [Tetraodon nigroviridis]
VDCEWSSCTFKGHSMEELSDHMSLHLKDYLGDNDTLEDLDEYACLWKGCEFLSMGSPAELEVHAYFHNYHGKLKFVGSQLLGSRPDLPSCNQELHSNNLVPEGSERFACLWEHCDVRVVFFLCGSSLSSCGCKQHHPLCSSSPRVRLTIPSGSTVMWTITSRVPSSSLSRSSNRLSSASGAVRRCRPVFKHLPPFFIHFLQCFHARVTGCDAFFKIRYRLREHMRSHTQERLVACPTCGSMFASNTKFFDHLHRQADPVESLVCEHCGKAFSREKLLRDHVRQHGEIKPRLPPIFLLCFIPALLLPGLCRDTLLDVHLMSGRLCYFSPVNQVKCPFCDMTCTTLAALKIHIRFRHCDERPFPCDFCDKRFKNQPDLQKHTEVHNEGTLYHCTVEGCQYSCQTFSTMSYHFKRAHQVGGAPKYKCHICDKVFSWCYTLTLHLRKKHELKWPSGHSRFRFVAADRRP